MKNVKVPDEVHAELKVRSVKEGISIGDYIGGLLNGKRTDLDIVLDQLKMIHERLDEINNLKSFDP